MKAEYEATCAQVEGLLADSRIHLPLAWMVNLILSYAETGYVDPDELQDLAKQVQSGLDNVVEGEANCH